MPKRTLGVYPLVLIVAAVLVNVLGWGLNFPRELDNFLTAPLSEFPFDLLSACLGAFCGCLVDDYFCSSKPSVFSRRSIFPAFFLTTVVTLLLPFHAASGLLFGFVLLACHALFTLLSSGQIQRCAMLASAEGIRGIFFVSGMAALIYQVSWQRKLIGVLGADGQSVAVIVAVFLGGLGCGALIGEKLASRISGKQGVIVFCLIEAAIGIFGVFSMNWLEWIGLLGASFVEPHKIIAVTAMALALPTLLMGMTLPLLVETLKEKIPVVHENVGLLYSLNALGSAVAALFASSALFPFVGLSGSVWLAALLNMVTVLLVWQASKGWLQSSLCEATVTQERGNTGNLSWQFAAGLALLTGFVTLSQEILLLRMMSWSASGKPWVFGLGVSAYLAGMGFGSYRVSKVSKQGLMREMSRMWLFTATAVFFLPAFSALMGGLTVRTTGAFLLSATLAVLGFFGGSSLPLIAGAVRSDDSGRTHFGVIYAMNIVGAVLGSGLTGYILLDMFSTAQCITLSALASLLIASIFVWRSEPRVIPFGILLPTIVTLLALPFSGLIYSHWREWLYHGKLSEPPFVRSIETRAGIIAVEKDFPADVVIGGGVYDGRFNVDPRLNVNQIHRAYLALALHPRPLRVLEIGLSSGSWAKGMLSFRGVKELVSIEINHGYEKLVRETPMVAGIFQDPRFRLVFADGRKWLYADQGHWDAIVINASFHWREGSTLLHSREFMQLAKSRLNPGGVLFINTTGAAAIAATALDVFPDVYQIGNGIAAVNAILPEIEVDALLDRLYDSSEFRAAFPSSSVAKQWVSEYKPSRLLRKSYLNCTILTDDSMSMEWGKGKCEPLQ